MNWSPLSHRAVWWLQAIGIFSLLIGPAALSFAQEPQAERALKYHQLLLSRPEPGYLFDRFYNTWLDESTVDALEKFLSARATETNATADQLLLAFFYGKKGDDVAALENFQRALAANPASAATLYYKSLVEARTLDFDSAIADLKKARDQSPDDKLGVLIDKQLGKLLVRNRKTAEAVEVWQALIKAHPDDDELYEDLIDLHVDEGLLSEAAQLTEALIARTKDPYLMVMRRLRLGDIRNRAGNREQAIAEYTLALNDVGNESWLEREILAQMEQVHRREDDIAGLKKFYDGLVEKYPKRIAVRRRQAQLLVEQNDNDAAIAAFREVMKLTPGDRATREEFVQMLAKIGKHDEAVTELKALADQFPKDAELRFRLATLYYDAKKPDEAGAAVHEYLATSDGSEYAFLRAARLLERFENKEAAAKVYAQMAEKFTDSPSAQEAYAAFLYASGEKDQALALWKALSANADVAQLLHVARALTVRNENEAALDMLKQRQADFAKEPLLLGQLVSTAFALKKYDEAIPWALARVDLAESVNDLEAAIDQAANIIERAEKLDEVSRQLESVERRSIPQTCLLADLFERTGSSDRADALLKEPAENGNLLAISEQIRLFSQRREWSAAADATRRILDLPDGRKSLYVRRLIELYQRDFQLEEALKWIDEWKRLSPGSTTPWVTESRLLSGLGKSDDALKVLRTAVLRFEDDQELRVRLAEFYSQSEKHADAERIYWQLYEQTEDVSDKLRWAQELAKLAQQQGTVQQLVDSFNERIAANRRSIVPLLSLSEVYRQTDDYEGRRRALTAASKIKPDDIHLLQQIARVAEQEGDWKAAVETLERALPLDKSSRTREAIAQLHLRNGNEQTGFAMLADLANSPDADPRAFEALADTLCGMQEWDRAADLLQKRLADFPDDYRLRYLMAVALEEATHDDAALEQFLRLLDDPQELPTKTNKGGQPGQQASMNSYYDMMRQLLPAEASDWFELAQYRHTAYSHRQQGSMRYSIVSTGGAARGAIQLPSNVEMVRPMALSHALTIISNLDEDKQPDAARALEARGIRDSEAWIRIDPRRGNFAPALVELLDKNPDDETALAILVVQRIGNRDPSMASHCQKAVEKFRSSRPQLALMAAFQAGIDRSEQPESAQDSTEDAAQPDRKKYLDEAFEIAATIDKPNPIVVMAITQSLGGMPGQNRPTNIDDADRKKIAQLLLKWYPALNSSPYGSYSFYLVAGSMSQNDDPAAYIQFLDEEVSRFQLGKGPNSRGMSAQLQLHGGNPTPLLSPLTFPPAQLADFPSNILALFSAGRDFNPYGVQLLPPGQGDDAAARVKPLIDKVKSPVLQILLAHAAGDDKQVDEGLGKMLAAKTPSVDAYLLAAGRASQNEKHQEVINLLGKARYLPMHPNLRQKIDAAIVAAAQTLKSASKTLSPELLEAGQQAALRLRRARLDAPQRNELIAAMEDLELQKEAKKLDELAAQTATPTAASSRAMIYAPASRATNAPDRISQMVAEGKSEAAAKLLATEVTGQVQMIFANPGSGRGMRYQFRELRRRIDGAGLTDAVLKALDPGETQNHRRINEYALALEMLEKEDEARAQYQRVLKMRPKDDSARMQIICLLAESDPAAAMEEVKQLAPSSRDAFGQMIGEQFQDYESSLAERIAMAGVAVEFIKTLQPGDITQNYWVENIVNSLGRYMHTNRGEGLPSMYQRADRGGTNRRRRPVDDELGSKRAQVHRDLCLAMLDNADFARTGFRHLLAAAMARDENTDEFVERAKKLLLDEAAAKPNRSNQANLGQVIYSNDSGEERFVSPEEFLATRAWTTGDWSLIDETIIPQLTGARMRPSRDRLERMSALYRCANDEFLARAEEVIRSSRSTSQQGENEGLAIVADVWAKRKLDVDLREMVLKQLKVDAVQQNHYRAPVYLSRLIIGGAEKWDRPKVLDFLDEVATIYIAPPGKRNDFIQKNYQRNQINWGSPSGKIYVYRQLMEQLCQNEDLLFTVLEHLQQYDQPPVENLEYRVREQVGRAVSEGPEAIMNFLAKSPWLRGVAEFEPLSLGAAGENAPFVGLVNQLTRDKDNKSKYRELFAQRQQTEPTFGGGLILACLEQQDQATSVADYLGTNIDAIRALPEDRQFDLAIVVNEVMRKDALNRKDLGEPAAATKQWLAANRAGKSQNMLARMTKAKRLEELGIENGNVDDFLRQNLAGMIRTDTDSAVKMFLRLCELSREAQRRGEWHMYFGGGRSTEGYLLQQVLYGVNDKDWSTYNFIADVIRNEKGQHIEATEVARQVASEATNAAMNRAPKGANGQTPSIDARVRSMYEELGPALGGRPASLLVHGFYDRVGGQLDPQQCQKIRSWSQAEAKGGEYPALAADLDAMLALIAEEKGPDRYRESKPGKRRAMADYHQHFATLLADTSLPLSWRIYLAEFLVQRQRDSLPLDLARQIVSLYVEALSAKVPVSGEQNELLTTVVLSLRDDESAKESNDQWRDQWAARYLRPARPQAYNQREFERLDEPGSATAICRALEMYLAAEDADRATTLLKKYDGQIGGLPQCLAVLVRAKRPNDVAQIMRRTWPTFQLDWPKSATTQFDAELAAELPAVYDQFDRNDLKYFAQLIFASAPDADKKNSGGELPAELATRDERLRALVEKFSEIEFADKALKKRCLVILSRSAATRDAVADRLAAEYKVESVVSAIQSNDGRAAGNQETQLATCHLSNCLRRGDCQPLLELFKRLNRDPNRQDYQFAQRLSPFIKCLQDGLNEASQPWSEQDCADLATQMRDFFKNRDYIYFNDYRTFNSLFIAVNCRSDNQEELEKWWKNLSDNNRSQLTNRGLTQDAWNYGLRLIGSPTDENLEPRLQYVARALRLALGGDWVRWNRNQQYYVVGQNKPLFAGIVETGLLSTDELASHGERIVGEVNNVPLVTAAWAEWLLSNREFDKAAKTWRSIVDSELKPDEKNPSEQQVNYVLKLAQALQGGGKLDEATSTLATLDGKQIPASSRNSLRRIKQELSKEAKKAQDKGLPAESTEDTPLEAEDPAGAVPAASPATKTDSQSKSSMIRPLHFRIPVVGLFEHQVPGVAGATPRTVATGASLRSAPATL